MGRRIVRFCRLVGSTKIGSRPGSSSASSPTLSRASPTAYRSTLSSPSRMICGARASSGNCSDGRVHQSTCGVRVRRTRTLESSSSTQSGLVAEIDPAMPEMRSRRRTESSRFCALRSNRTRRIWCVVTSQVRKASTTRRQCRRPRRDQAPSRSTPPTKRGDWYSARGDHGVQAHDPPRNASGDTAIRSPCTTVLSVKYAKPQPASAIAVHTSDLDVATTRYAAPIPARDAVIAPRRRRSVTNSPANTAPRIAPTPVADWRARSPTRRCAGDR